MDELLLDSEIVYRCIFYDKNCYTVKDNQVRISSISFNDRDLKPSVDRAILSGYNPCLTQATPDDGVIGLDVKLVRLIKVDLTKTSDQPMVNQYKIDVIHRPIETNEAHSQIEPSPDYQNASRFKKVQERLARIAQDKIDSSGWEIRPSDLR